ncbi:sugar ABC transporter permease [Streptantibioticus ferralitis]|uniref:Sugar ABC transporter permease n=1 Tax=Streptantibioticus ferralitis TaxID=236510 RepID=A0ABT5YWK1_9ACTN|nr:sugar ABC transporter permease [Streptantibioticus ferralitis]MDF2255736.1 sugar ABC transporter permease [Streptantibioticus ferralitis]
MARPADEFIPDAALTAMLDRVRATAREVGDRFPLYAEPGTGVWTSTRRGSWTAGYWTGLLWLAAWHSGAPEDRRRAVAWTTRLRERAGDDTVTRAMTFWYGAAPGHLLCGDDTALAVALEGAEALAASYDERLGLIPLGTALGQGPDGRSATAIDSVAAVTALLSWASRTAGRPRLLDLARGNAVRHRDLCLMDDGGVRAGVALAPVAGQEPSGAHPAGGWSRGQAWGILSFATAARALHMPEFTSAAGEAARYWAKHAATAVPSWSFTDPGGPRDTSAAAIAAVGLLALADPDGDQRTAARRLVATLVEGHLTGFRDGSAVGRPAGMLLDGCYDMASGTATGHELIWGDFFLALALAQLTTPRDQWPCL